jgi:hypothetical protein
MTAAQNRLYWREWSAVRKAFPDADRHEVTTRALGQAKSHLSFTERDFDLVLGAFRAMSKPDLNGQLRQDNGDVRRMMHRIHETQQMLGVYVEDVAGYVSTVLADKFGVPVGGSKTVDDLDTRPRVFRNRKTGDLVELPSELMQLQITLYDRLQTMRKKHGHTLHELAQLAGVKCTCAACNRRRKMAGKGDLAPRRELVGVSDTEENPF